MARTITAEVQSAIDSAIVKNNKGKITAEILHGILTKMNAAIEEAALLPKANSSSGGSGGTASGLKYMLYDSYGGQMFPFCSIDMNAFYNGCTDICWAGMNKALAEDVTKIVFNRPSLPIEIVMSDEEKSIILSVEGNTLSFNTKEFEVRNFSGSRMDAYNNIQTLEGLLMDYSLFFRIAVTGMIGASTILSIDEILEFLVANIPEAIDTYKTLLTSTEGLYALCLLRDDDYGLGKTLDFEIMGDFSYQCSNINFYKEEECIARVSQMPALLL